MSIHTIVVDGGPCGGKTNVMTFLQEKLADFGYHVIVVGEMATELILAGFGPQVVGIVTFQEILLKRIIQKEDDYKKLASMLHTEHEKIVILCDRGTMTGAAYVAEEQFKTIIRRAGHTVVDLRDKRYDGVLFLRSVAVDKPELYTLANNPARSERTVEEARALDTRTEWAWGGCEHMWIIDNQTDVHGKFVKALQAICRTLGIPKPLEIEKKYRVSPEFDTIHIRNYPGAVTVNIIQDYLVTKNDPGSERVRARTQDGSTVYTHTIKEHINSGARLEYQRRISLKEYLRLLKQKDRDFAQIIKERTCFVHRNQYFEFDQFLTPSDVGYHLLEDELTEEGSEVILPDFFEGFITDVTEDPSYSNAAIALEATQPRFLRGM